MNFAFTFKIKGNRQLFIHQLQIYKGYTLFHLAVNIY